MGGFAVRVAWLSLDDGDDDPAHFLSYLVAALARIVPDLALPEQEPPPLAEILLTGLINQVAALPPASCLVLVLDDYHLVEAVPIHQALRFCSTTCRRSCIWSSRRAPTRRCPGPPARQDN